MPKPRIEVGVKSQLWLIFYPHPNLPPARGKELSVNANIK
jgi:hypothetical protein